MIDTFNTILNPTEFSLYKDKGSKFYGYAYAVEDETEIILVLEQLRKQHNKARHFCYAWRLGWDGLQYRVNDDGEPSGSAGLPIYGQIQSKDLTNILIVIVRYFGGTKLGVSGLITAYKTASISVLQNATIITKTIDNQFIILFSYENMDKVLRLLKNTTAKIESSKLDLKCEYKIAIRKSESEKLISELEELRCLEIISME